MMKNFLPFWKQIIRNFSKNMYFDSMKLKIYLFYEVKLLVIGIICRKYSQIHNYNITQVLIVAKKSFQSTVYDQNFDDYLLFSFSLCVWRYSWFIALTLITYLVSEAYRYWKLEYDCIMCFITEAKPSWYNKTICYLFLMLK